MCGTKMQLLATENNYYVKSVRTVLKCCRTTAKLSTTQHQELADLDDFQIFGDIFCFIGKITVENINYLLLVVECTKVATIGVNQASVLRIDKVCALPLLKDGYTHCRIFEKQPPQALVNNNNLRRFKNHHKKFVKFVSEKVSQAQNSKLIDDIVRFINMSGNFYFSMEADLTLTAQRSSQEALKSDLRFFWNRGWLKEFFNDESIALDNFKPWITPLIYGYVDQKTLTFEADINVNFLLISRRSVHRAGVRYLRRGIDEKGHVANFVETEFTLHSFGHCLSFVQIRGSVPIFWSQKGYQFRPPLSIDRNLTDSLPIFEKHMDSLIETYDSPIIIINLVEQIGREACLGEAYVNHVLELNSPNIVFYSFDFHQNCKSLRFHKINELIETLEKDIAKMGFCWLDKDGKMVRSQKGVLRTNCVDCLDRTNLVQSAISQAVCIVQAQKLGLIEPITNIPSILTRLIQGMWADHGDSISKQYAGTNALKGDVTRCGQRKLMGFMRDGYNSASRYYLSHMHDSQRQHLINVLLAGSDRKFDDEEILMSRVLNDTNMSDELWSNIEDEDEEIFDEEEEDLKRLDEENLIDLDEEFDEQAKGLGESSSESFPVVPLKLSSTQFPASIDSTNSPENAQSVQGLPEFLTSRIPESRSRFVLL